MKKVRYKVSINGLSTPRGAISFNQLQAVTGILAEGAERALRLALEGQSTKKGPMPAWLSQSTDFILAGMNKGSTTLVIDAPTLGEAAREQIGQADLWLMPPKAGDTALTLLAQSFHDATSELLESERYDTGVLDTLLSFKQLLRDEGLSIKLTSDKRHGESFVLDRAALNKIQKVKQTTPEPQAILVSGFFDAIEHSRRRFQLAMQNGEIIRGKIDESLVDIEQMRKLWAQQVTIKGTLHFNASGKPRFLEAQTVNASQAGGELFESIDVPQSPTQIWKQVRTELSNQNVVAEIWGKWPGDESIEQLLDMLKSSESAN